MPGFLEEFILQLRAVLVGFDRANGFHNCLDPRIHSVLTQLFVSQRAIAGIVIWKPRIPPDRGVEIFRQLDTGLIAAGLLPRTIHMNQVRT